MKPIVACMLISIFLSCKSIKKENTLELCFANKFYQPVEKVSLGDAEKIKKMSGKFVQIEGVFNDNFEDVSLNPSKHSSPTEALWLNFTDSVVGYQGELDKLNGRRVLIIGRVNPLNKGHYNGYIAALDSVFCIKEIR